MTFIDACLAGVASVGDMDTYIEEWHNSDTKYELHEYLGLTWGEYMKCAVSPSELSAILEARKVSSVGGK